MELFLDCLPCLLRQVLESARMATGDEAVQGEIMDDALTALAAHRSYASAPALAHALHTTVQRDAGVADPYAAVKERDIAAALRLEGLIADFAAAGPDPLLRALKASATGNVMDSALYSSLDLDAVLAEELATPFAVCDLDALRADLRTARTVLIIGDNAGEAVFDKVLVRELASRAEVTFAVRGRAIINDVTMADAYAVGMDRHATIVSSGCPAPGAIPAMCDEAFRALFDRADVVISKGQGNLEALSGSRRRIYFLLKAKCPRLADELGVDVGQYVLTARAG